MTYSIVRNGRIPEKGPCSRQRGTARRIGLFCLIALLPSASFAFEDGGNSALERFEFSQIHMGRPVRLVVYASDLDKAAEACRAAFRRIAELDQVMSDYRPDSELMQLVARAGEGPQPISRDLMAVLQAAQRAAERTEGAFDITVAPLSHLWRDAIYGHKRLPDPEAIREARERVGWRKLVLDPEAGTAELKWPGMRLDLGGIGKGLAGDAALAVLAEHGLERALYQAGGDIVVGQRPPDRPGWRVRHPFLAGENGPEEGSFLHLERQALSTSGDTEQYIEVDGVRYAHIVDPRSGQALTERYFATILAPNGVTADKLSTAATVLGPQRMRETLERWYPEATLFIRRVP